MARRSLLPAVVSSPCAAPCCVVTSTWLVPRTAAAAEAGKLVLVLDSSGSMAERVGGKTKISLAKSALT